MSISLLEAEPPKPHSPWPRRIALALATALLVGATFYFGLRHYREKRHVARFFDALVAEDFRRAYELWKPAPSFTYEEFLAIWGPKGDYGRIGSYQILAVESTSRRFSSSPSGIVIAVRINNLDPPERLWVERRDKSLSFPPFPREPLAARNPWARVATIALVAVLLLAAALLYKTLKVGRQD